MNHVKSMNQSRYIPAFQLPETKEQFNALRFEQKVALKDQHPGLYHKFVKLNQEEQNQKYNTVTTSLRDLLDE